MEGSAGWRYKRNRRVENRGLGMLLFDETSRARDESIDKTTSQLRISSTQPSLPRYSSYPHSHRKTISHPC